MAPNTSDNTGNGSTAERLRLVKGEVARIQQLAEAKALKKQLAFLASDNDPEVQTASDHAQRLVDDIKQELLSSPTCAASSSAKPSRSPEPIPQDNPPSKWQRHAESLSHNRVSDTSATSSAAMSVAVAPEQSNRAPRKGSLQRADINWLQENADKYRSVGRNKGAISWKHLLADNKSLAERMTSRECAVAWTKQKTYNREKNVQRLLGPPRLQPEDIAWLHANVERYRGLGHTGKDISWVHVLADNKDLAARMSGRACSVAWKTQLLKEKNPCPHKRRKTVRKEIDEDDEAVSGGKAKLREASPGEPAGEDGQDSSDEAEEVEEQLFSFSQS